MKTHQFYNLLDGKISLPYLRSSELFEYPQEFLDRYNAQVDVIAKLRNDTLAALDCMTQLEQEQFKYTVKK